MSTAVVVGESAPAETFWSRYHNAHPAYRVSNRWLLIAFCTGVAFHESFVSIAYTTERQGIGGYVWTVFTASALVAVGVARRKRNELPIHDRQTDII
ncbi:MAG: hypothetical protein QOH57_1606, partial [Mycobacterium sp.]|nr:hypothetical protein [Mycobacterium sp.]